MNTKQRKAVADLHAVGHSAQQISTLLGIDVAEVTRVLNKPKAAAARPTVEQARPAARTPAENRTTPLGRGARAVAYGTTAAAIHVSADVSSARGRDRMGL